MVPPVSHADVSANELTTNGVMSDIRLGKIHWPPAKHDSEKQEVHVGRLMIDENKNEQLHVLDGTLETTNLIKADFSADSPITKKDVTVGKLDFAQPPLEPAKVCGGNVLMMMYENNI